MPNQNKQSIPKPPATRRRMSRHGSVLIETTPRQIPWDLIDRLLVPILGCHAAAIVIAGVLNLLGISQVSAFALFVFFAIVTVSAALGFHSLKENDTVFQFGLSTLHAWIRFFEYFLHLSYRLEIKKWQIQAHEKFKTDERKKNIQQKFKLELGLNVDKPRAGGAGTSNDGNTARRFFENVEKSAEITGLDVAVMRRCGSILQAMASGFKIHEMRFELYCLETARMLVKLYPWYYMPVSVHKILIHGSKVVASFMVPIGQLSEEAQEARNKDIRRFREGYTRKMSRTATNVDLFNRLLVSSDPLITTMIGFKKKAVKALAEDAKHLLEEKSLVEEDHTNSDSEDGYSE